MDSININLVKEQFDKAQYSKVVDTSITKLVPPVTATDTTQITVEQFFVSYEELFTSIPKFGSRNSHEYLVQQSGDYIGSDSNQEQIQLLLEEINSLRSDLLTANQRIIELESNQTNG